MTLSRQLILLVSVLVLLLFLGTFFISAYNTRDYLETQLSSHAQDAATSLGLSASSHVAEKDKALVSAMVNAMIHRGDYLNIQIKDLKGKVWIDRSGDLSNTGAPDWFVSMFALDPPTGGATMMSGWRQVGYVEVTSHPGLAYRQLWQNARETLTWFVVGALGILLIGLISLRLLLKPLKEVEWQADAICKREFPVVQKQPFTLEFRRVVEAMNRLSEKVSQMLMEAERLASRMREQAYQDPVTGLANRRQFMDVLEHRIADSDTFQQGGVVLLQLNDFKAFNQEYGYPAGDRLLVAVAELLVKQTVGLDRATVAHMAGADFAVLVEDADQPQLAGLASQIADAASALYGEMDMPSADIAHVGAVMYEGQSASELMSLADLALRQAQRNGANAWQLLESERGNESVRSASEWTQLIQSAVESRSFTLLRQPVYGTADRALLHEEVFLRLVDPAEPGKVIAAGIFMPMADNAGLAPAIDQAVLGQVLDLLAEDSQQGKLAVNMSPSTLLDVSIAEWLLGELAKRPGVAPRLILEWPEYGATAHIAELRAWIDLLEEAGVEFSLDHFGKGFTSFAYLRELKAHYLKIDGSYLQALEKHPDNQFFLTAIGEIAHGLDMKVLAESVETEPVWRQLSQLGMDGGRGYWLGEPA